jgi:murein DD-endopeptidase MepM/ murein hydrolase activator NlpD
LLSERKTYYFNNYTLRFESKVSLTKVRFVKAFRFFCMASILSLSLIVLFVFTMGSPSEVILKSQISEYSKNYIALNRVIDSLENQLQNQLFVSDKFYREILVIDSLPYPIRAAGMGGSEITFDLFAFPYSTLINSTMKKIEGLKKQVEIQQNSFTRLYIEALKFNKELHFVPAIMPVRPSSNISISSAFGCRFDPFTFINKSHEGIDFVGPVNTQIFCSADGIVTLAEDNRTGYGKEIVLLHDFGFSTRYAHLNKILVTSGQKVSRGQLIGQMGSTGRSTGTHLHYEVRLFNRPLNPYNYFADDLTEQDYDFITKQNKLAEN